MAVRLGKFANFLIKVERFAASIRYWTETGSKGRAKLSWWPSGSTKAVPARFESAGFPKG